MNIKYNNEQIIELHSKGYTDSELAKILDIDVSKMRNKRHRLGLKPNLSKRVTHILTDEEIEILLGIVLGDATIRYVHKHVKYPNLTFAHCLAQKEWFQWLSNKLINLKSSINIYNSKYICSNGERSQFLQFTGMNMPCLIPIRDAFYLNNKKIIPMELVKRHFSELSIYCWFMDDGSYDKTNNSFIVNTQCFDYNELKKFVDFLNSKFGLYFVIKKDKSLYLKHCSNTILLNILIDKNECNSMSYKYGGRH